jgi:predicted membrane metal-binding protein
MILAYMLAIVIDRAREALASLALAAIVICFAMPGSSGDIGFQLSFVSVIVIILGRRRFVAGVSRLKRDRRALEGAAPRSWIVSEVIIGYLAVSFWAMLGTAPIDNIAGVWIESLGAATTPATFPITTPRSCCGFASARTRFCSR